MKTRIIKRYLLNLLFALIIPLSWISITLFYNPDPEAEVMQKNLTELQKQSVQILIEMNKLTISLGLLTVGGIGTLLLGKYEAVKIRSLTARFTIAISSFFAIYSVYFGYVLYDSLVEMLSNQIFNLSSALIEYPRRLQYYCLWLSIVLFIIFFLNEISRTEKDEQNDAANAQNNNDEFSN